MKYLFSILVLLSVTVMFLNAKNALIDKKWMLQQNQLSRSAFLINGVYNYEIYFMEDADKSFFLNFYNSNGSIIHFIKFNKGKGPGELMFPSSAVFYESKIFIYDDKLNRISIYSTNGSYIDDFLLNITPGTRSQMLIFRDSYIFHDNYEHELYIVDFAGNFIKKVTYPTPIIGNEINGKNLNGGGVFCDDNYVYIGYYQKPYKIKIFDNTFNEDGTLTRKIKGDYSNYRFKPSGKGMEGDLLIGSLKSYGNKLYAVYGGNILGEKGKMHISVFDIQTRKFIDEVKCQDLDVIHGLCKIIGVTKDHIVLFIQGYENEDAKHSNNRTGSVLLIRNVFP